METLLVLIAAAITLMALDTGDQARRRGSSKHRIAPLLALNMPNADAESAVTAKWFLSAADRRAL